MKTTITVTAEDIAKGKPKQCQCCPLALAITRALGQQVSVSPEYVGLERFTKAVWIQLPRLAAAFLRAFDFGRPVKPFSFELDVPEVAK